ncbi:hypothetical protein HV819_07840 [Anaerococcus sp. AGMB00486]|uniref:Uncharacterized protein n=1 Tax=Anaerococcus faecalis TaxID=2742993 RepID=A0ABX2NB21_9FIRM|nr:hypothetical protein [Anaerococcus faecalis]NVF11888.1 hypothetical protein [Anaerococcus faecalis]
MFDKVDFKLAYILDDMGFFIGSLEIDTNVEHDFKYTLIKPNERYIKPKFDGEKWVEGVNMSEYMVDMLLPNEKMKLSDYDFLILKILGILKEGGMMMENKWFFQYCMFCWAERKIEESYLDMAKKLNLLSDEQVMMIKMTPRVSEDKK